MQPTTTKWYRSIKKKYLVLAGALPVLWQIDEKLLDNRISKNLTSWVVHFVSYASTEHPVPFYVLILIFVASSAATALLIVIPGRRAMEQYRKDYEISLMHNKEESELALKRHKEESELALERYRQEIALLQKQLRFDDLTKIPNRRQLEIAFRSSKDRLPKPFCVCYLDIVDFGEINKTIDHEPANRVLVEFANVVKNVLREDDELFRLEGDQFALVLCGTGVSGAAACAGRITERLVKTPCYAGKHPDTDKPMMVPVRCRFGITDCAETDVLEDCLRRADAALNRAKANDTSKGNGESAVEIISKADAEKKPSLLSAGYAAR